jgi:hypothetical protein
LPEWPAQHGPQTISEASAKGAIGCAIVAMALGFGTGSDLDAKAKKNEA